MDRILTSVANKAAAARRKIELRESRNVRAIYRHVFGKRWPKGWVVHWNVLGSTSFQFKLLYLCFSRVADDPWTVIHELVHMAHPRLPHGKAFERKVRQYFMKAKKVFGWQKLKH